MKKGIAVILAVLMLFSVLCGCAPKKGGTVKIGVFEPLTGDNAAGGQMELEGIKTALSVKAEAAGMTVELVEADNKSNDADAVAAAKSLIAEGVSVVIGSWGSSVSIAAGQTFAEAGIPVIGTSCTNPLVTNGNDYYFRVCYMDAAQGALLAQYAKSKGCNTAAIICDISDVYSIGLREKFMAAYGSGNIVAEAYFNKGDTDFAAQLSSVMAKEPGAVFVPGEPATAGAVLKQAASLGYTGTLFLGGDTWESTALLEAAGSANVNACFTTFFDVDAEATEASTEFLTAYAALYEDGTPKGAVTALGYDAYMTAVAAIEKANSSDAKAICRALAGLTVDGVTGSFSFDENGDATKNLAVVKTVKDGKFVYDSTVTLAN